MSTESELPEASDTATRILSWSRPVNLDELTLEISKACVAYAERVNRELDTFLSEKSILAYQNSQRAEKAEAEVESLRANNRYQKGYHDGEQSEFARTKKAEAELTAAKEQFYDSVEQMQKYRNELDKLREDVKPLLEHLFKATEFKTSKPDYWSTCSQCSNFKSDAEDILAAFLEKHPELKEKA